MPRDFNIYDHALRPWDEVARMFTERTGIKMTVSNAFETHARAMGKLRREFERLIHGGDPTGALDRSDGELRSPMSRTKESFEKSHHVVSSPRGER